MLIDWFTVSAQLINFIVLVYLMKRFLYKPVLEVIDKREQLIATKVDEAKEKEKKAQDRMQELTSKIKAFDDNYSSKMKEIEDKVKGEKNRLMLEATESVEIIKRNWQKDLKKQEIELEQSIVSKIHREVISLTRKTLEDLANADLESHIVDVFLIKLEKYFKKNSGSKEIISLDKHKEFLVRCTSKLSENQIQQIINTLKKVMKREVKVKQEIAPNLLSGIELILDGQKIVWSIENYLRSIEEIIHTSSEGSL